jgi:TonB-dependent receptor
MLAGLGVVAVAPAFAQEVGMETVVVTGIRASLQSAQTIKQNSDQVVDSITAVDIGALPDNSVAEALQRVPGVQITRTDQPNDPLRWASNGNGVFIRGLSWVKSLTNGEEIFGAENGRTISFADVSPDLMAGVDVYKNPNAKMIEGGVGGTVNLKTRMPFDFDGLKMAASGSYDYGTLSPTGGMSGNLLVSDRFNTRAGEIGVLLSASYQDLVNGNNIAVVDPWSNVQKTGPWTAGDGTGNHPSFRTNEYYPRGLTKAFGMVGYRHMDWKQPRVSLDATVQWRPTESLEITFVGLYSRAEPQSEEHNVAWIIPVTNSEGCGLHTDLSAALNADGTCTYPIGSLQTLQAPDTASANASMASYKYDANGYLNKGTIFNAQSDSTYVNYFDTRYDVRHHTNKNAELTLKWTPNNNLAVTVDASYIDSRATMSSMTMYYGTKSDRYMQSSNYGGHAEFYPGAPHIDVSFDLTDGSPKITYNAAGAAALGTQSEYLWAAAMDHYENNYAHAYTTRADATYTFNGNGLFGWVKSAEAGVRTDLKSSATRNTGWNWGRIGFTTWNALGCGRRSDYGGNFKNPVTDCATPLGDLSTQLAGNTERYKFPDLFGTAMPATWEPSLDWMKHPYQVWSDLQPMRTSLAALKWPYNADGTLATGYSTAADSYWTPATVRDGNCSGTPYLCNSVYVRGTVNNQREDTLAGYFMLNYAHATFLGMDLPVDGNVGVRIVNTQYNSGPGQLRLPNVTDCGTALAGSDRAKSCTFVGTDNNSTTTYAGVSNHYTNVLPSFNFRAGMTDNLQLRLAYSQGLVRPDLERMRNYTQLGYSWAGGITPHANDSFASSNALSGSGSNPYLKPTYSQNYDASLEWYFAPTGNVAVALFHKTIGNYVMSGVAPMAFTRNGVTQTFNVGSYVNGSKGTVEGFEFSYQQFYDSLPGALSGLGTQFNYTKIYNSGGANPVAAIYNPINGVNVYANINGTDFTPGALGYAGDTRLPMEGMSNDSFNAALMYEKYGISGRLAYNWRSRNLVNSYPANIFEPVFQRSYGQLDASVLYTVLDHYKVGVQASNLLKQTAILEVGQTVATKHIYQWVEGERKFSVVLRATW